MRFVGSVFLRVMCIWQNLELQIAFGGNLLCFDVYSIFIKICFFVPLPSALIWLLSLWQGPVAMDYLKEPVREFSLTTSRRPRQEEGVCTFTANGSGFRVR